MSDLMKSNKIIREECVKQIEQIRRDVQIGKSIRFESTNEMNIYLDQL